VELFNEENARGARVFLPEWPYAGIWRRCADPTVPGGHADSFTTSMALYLKPESVRPDLIPGAENGPVDWEDPNLDFASYSRTGVIGDPTHASAELGERMWPEVVAEVARTFKEIADAPVGTPR
jgi:creatinine amidohydrolase